MTFLEDVSSESMSLAIGDNFAEVMKYMHSYQVISIWHSERDVERVDSELNTALV